MRPCRCSSRIAASTRSVVSLVGPTDVPVGISMLIVKNSGAPPGNSVMGMNLSKNRLPPVTANATSIVINLCRSAPLSSGV